MLFDTVFVACAIFSLVALMSEFSFSFCQGSIKIIDRLSVVCRFLNNG
jgi:hypothetical protein